jgi:hypothetical protein
MVLRSAIPNIRVSGTNSQVDGVYRDDSTSEFTCNRNADWNGEMLSFPVARLDDGDWAVVGTNLPEEDDDIEAAYANVEDTMYWTCPFSENLSIPPRDNWKPVHGVGNLNIEYIYRTNY